MAREILVGKLRIEDTEAYQDTMRMYYEKFCEILTVILVIYQFRFEPVFGKPAHYSFQWQKLLSVAVLTKFYSKVWSSK